MLLPEQIETIKKQLIEQIISTFPEEKKKSAIDQIKVMNAEQLEEFLIQNKLIKQDRTSQQHLAHQDQVKPQTPQKCIFCSIVSEEIQSYKIDENKDSIAILEINPISKGHSLIIPKEHTSSLEKLPKTALSLTKKITKKIQSKLKPKEVVVSSSNLFGHEIINVLPVYKEETIESQRQQSKPEDLLKLQKLLEKKKSLQKIKKPKRINLREKLWLPKRIP